MQLHVPAPHLHFPPATPPRSEPALLSPGRRPDFIPASLFNTDQSVPAIFQSAPFAGVVQTRFHARIPCSALPARRSPRVSCKLALFSLVNVLIPARSHSRQTHIALGLRFRLSISSTLRSQGYPQVLFEPHSNSLAQCRGRRHPAAIAHASETTRWHGFLPLLRTSARRLADVTQSGIPTRFLRFFFSPAAPCVHLVMKVLHFSSYNIGTIFHVPPLLFAFVFLSVLRG